MGRELRKEVVENASWVFGFSRWVHRSNVHWFELYWEQGFMGVMKSSVCTVFVLHECVGPPGCELADSPTEVPSAVVWMCVLQPDLELGVAEGRCWQRLSVMATMYGPKWFGWGMTFDVR